MEVPAGRSAPTWRSKSRRTCWASGESRTLASRTRPPRWCWRLIWEDVDLAAGVIHVRAQRWLLFCCDRNERCWPYDDIGPSVSVDPLLAEIDADPTEIFRG